MASGLLGALAGALTVMTSDRADVRGLAPGLVIWGCALVAAASCDAVTQRIPTPLIRQATVVTCALLVGGLSVHADWRGLVLSGVGSAAATVSLLLCWRFAGAGFGDVRLAALGGLGLGHATHEGLLLGLVAFGAMTGVQAGVALARGGTRRTLIPYGPALAAGFLIAATCRP
ncbi:peptidase [uncultured Modestobacter sp.]|uniref:peptidase n=1 Tax=uncultured Modestobacter sp. TaxID=380048 RepID=UPI00260CA322|nr:peptidase [uncultured Modestobacter sp.]